MGSGKREQNIVAGFAHHLLRDCRPVPMTLLHCYRAWGLSESELICLLRLIAPMLDRGRLSRAEVAAEFGCAEDSTQAITQPFCSRGLLEYEEKEGIYTCNGMINALYESWAVGNRPACATDRSTGSKSSRRRQNLQDSKEMQELSRLYRRFEQGFGRNLKYTESDRLRSWLDEEKIPPELIDEALTRAVMHDKCSFAYIYSILQDWQQKKLTTLELVRKYDIKQEQPAARSGRKTAAKKVDQHKYDELYEAILKE